MVSAAGGRHELTLEQAAVGFRSGQVELGCLAVRGASAQELIQQARTHGALMIVVGTGAYADLVQALPGPEGR